MHIRQVLVKAELEKYQQYKDVYTALKKGKLCFCCRTRRFSFFTWSYTCQFCKRPVCSQCCKKMRLPSKPYSTLPIFSLGPSTLQRGESFMRPEKPSTSHHRSLRSIPRLASRSKSVDKSHEELQFSERVNGGLEHDGGVCGLQEVHFRNHQFKPAQPVPGQQASQVKKEDTVLLHVVARNL